LLIKVFFSGVFTADWIKPDVMSESKTEGESVTLKCSYETSSNAVVLFWYRQYPNRALQYLLYRGALYQSGDDHTADSRFESTASESSTDLTVTVRLADTALYYCALRVGAFFLQCIGP
uniref:Ig-like domain-containing protein n=1 Tax=Astyanax mexicanus TaxID=7994 RepID=A0A8B9GWG4_ASTMX